MSIRIDAPHQIPTPNLDSQSSQERNSDFNAILS